MIILPASPFPDAVSAEQQQAVGPQQDQDENKADDDDVSMEMENQEEDLEATEIQELKSEQLDSSKASQQGDSFSCP